jgi:glutamyl-tRNA reductase
MRVSKMLTGILVTAITAAFQEQLQNLSEKQAKKIKKTITKQAKKLAKRFAVYLKKKEKRALKAAKTFTHTLTDKVVHGVENSADKLGQAAADTAENLIKGVQKILPTS